MLRILYGCGWSSGKSRIAESGPALFFCLRVFGIADTAAAFCESKYKANPWTGDDHNTCRVFNNGHNLWKNLACRLMFHVKHYLCYKAVVGRIKRISSDACRPSEIQIGIRSICFTWNNWESKRDNTKLGVNVRSKVKKHCERYKAFGRYRAG